MKSMSFCLAVMGILLSTTFHSACKAQTRHQKNHMANAADQPHTSDDDQLLREVEQFASSDEHSSASAWQELQGRDRSKLIGDLTRIMRASRLDDRNRVFIAFTFCRLGHEYRPNREIVISAVSKNTPFRNLYGDWAVSLVRRLMIEGDADLMALLFDVSDWSDGAMSLELAHAYSQALAIEPENFLRMLTSRPESTRSRVIKLLEYNSLTADEKTKVKYHLKNLSRQSKFRLTAEQVTTMLTN